MLIVFKNCYFDRYFHNCECEVCGGVRSSHAYILLSGAHSDHFAPSHTTRTVSPRATEKNIHWVRDVTRVGLMENRWQKKTSA